MEKEKDLGKEMWNVLGFQYKPLEKKAKEYMTEETKKRYDNLNYVGKINYLDNLASKLGY